MEKKQQGGDGRGGVPPHQMFGPNTHGAPGPPGHGMPPPGAGGMMDPRWVQHQQMMYQHQMAMWQSRFQQQGGAPPGMFPPGYQPNAFPPPGPGGYPFPPQQQQGGASTPGASTPGGGNAPGGGRGGMMAQSPGAFPPYGMMPPMMMPPGGHGGFPPMGRGGGFPPQQQPPPGGASGPGGFPPQQQAATPAATEDSGKTQNSVSTVSTGEDSSAPPQAPEDPFAALLNPSKTPATDANTSSPKVSGTPHPSTTDAMRELMPVPLKNAPLPDFGLGSMGAGGNAASQKSPSNSRVTGNSLPTSTSHDGAPGGVSNTAWPGAQAPGGMFPQMGGQAPWRGGAPIRKGSHMKAPHEAPAGTLPAALASGAVFPAFGEPTSKTNNNDDDDDEFGDFESAEFSTASSGAIGGGKPTAAASGDDLLFPGGSSASSAKGASTAAAPAADDPFGGLDFFGGSVGGAKGGKSSAAKGSTSAAAAKESPQAPPKPAAIANALSFDASFDDDDDFGDFESAEPAAAAKKGGDDAASQKPSAKPSNDDFGFDAAFPDDDDAEPPSASKTSNDGAEPKSVDVDGGAELLTSPSTSTKKKAAPSLDSMISDAFGAVIGSPKIHQHKGPKMSSMAAKEATPPKTKQRKQPTRDYNAFAGALDDLVSTTLHLEPHLASDVLGHTSAAADVAVELGAEARPKQPAATSGGGGGWATSGGGDDEDDDWGDFEGVGGDKKPSASAGGDEDDGFGDFASANAVSDVSAPSSKKTKKTKKKDKKTEKSASKAGFEADFGDDDDFGDFESAGDSASQTASKASANDPFANLDAPSSTSTPTPAPSDFSDPFADLSGAFSPQKPAAPLANSLSPPPLVAAGGESSAALSIASSLSDGDDNKVAELSLSFGGSGLATPSATSGGGATPKGSSPKSGGGDSGVFAWDDGDDDHSNASGGGANADGVEGEDEEEDEEALMQSAIALSLQVEQPSSATSSGRSEKGEDSGEEEALPEVELPSVESVSTVEECVAMLRKQERFAEAIECEEYLKRRDEISALRKKWKRAMADSEDDDEKFAEAMVLRQEYKRLEKQQASDDAVNSWKDSSRLPTGHKYFVQLRREAQLAKKTSNFDRTFPTPFSEIDDLQKALKSQTEAVAFCRSLNSMGSDSSKVPTLEFSDFADADSTPLHLNGDAAPSSASAKSGPATEASHGETCRRVLEFVQPQLDSCRDTVVNLSTLVLPQDTDSTTLEPLLRYILSVHEMYRVCCRLEAAFAHTFDSKPPKAVKKLFSKTRKSWKALVDAVKLCTAINQTAVKPLLSFDRASVSETPTGEVDVSKACRVCCLPAVVTSKGREHVSSCVPCVNLWVNCVSKTLP